MTHTHWWITKRTESENLVESRDYFAHSEEQADAMVDLLLQECAEAGMAYYGKQEDTNTLTITFKHHATLKLVRITQSVAYTEEEWQEIDIAPEFDRKVWSKILSFEE